MKKRKIDLPTQILIGLFLGIIVGFVFKKDILWIKPVGTAFIRLITMIVVPLVFASLFVGTASIGDPKKLGRIGSKTLAFFLITTIISAGIGLVFANVFKPGKNISSQTKDQMLARFKKNDDEGIEKKKKAPGVVEKIVNIIPKNPIKALSESIMLQIIFFAIFMGIAVSLIPKNKADPLLQFFEAVNDLMIKMVLLIMKLAPLGVFALITVIIGEFGAEILFALGKFTIIVIAASLLHMYTVFPVFLKLFTKMRIKTFFQGIRPAQMIAFSTTSSGATLPVTMECCEVNLNVPKEISSFVLPLGATINMDGTSLYQGIAALFIAEVYGIHLTFIQQLVIVGTATLGAIGTAGVPGAAIIMLSLVLQAVNIPLEAIALVFGVDRIVDMFRTVLNVTGDASCAVYIAHTEKELTRKKQLKI